MKTLETTNKQPVKIINFFSNIARVLTIIIGNFLPLAPLKLLCAYLSLPNEIFIILLNIFYLSVGNLSKT